MQHLLAQYPLGFAQWLAALDYALAHPREVAIVGDIAREDTKALLGVCVDGYQPHRIVAVGSPEHVPLLQGREPVNGRATAYLCVDFTCRPPVSEPESLRALLEEANV